MADSSRCRTNWLGLMGAIVLACTLLLCASDALLYAQGGWRSTPVVSELWLGKAEVVDSTAMPGIVFTNDGLIYLAFSLRGGEWHYYTKDHPAGRGVFSGFSPVFRPGGSQSYSAGAGNLLAVDSGSTLHYISAFAVPDPCLQYASNQLNDTVLTSFGYLDDVGSQSCGGKLGGASTAVDGTGRLHMVSIIDDALFYFTRVAGVWSPGVRISDPSSIAQAPSIGVTPSGYVHVAYLTRATSSASDAAINYVGGIGGMFSDPVTLGSRNGQESDGVPSLAVDQSGACHIAFADQSSGNLPSIRYARNVGGVWSKVESVLEDSRYAFGDVSLAADRYGAVHIVAAYRMNHPDSLPDGELLYVRNAGAGWSQPMNITANDLEEGAVNQGNGFTALHDSMLAVVYTVRDARGDYSIALSQFEINFNPLLEISSDTINLGERYADAETWTVNTAIDVRNGGGALYGALHLGDVTVLDAVPQGLTLAPVQKPGAIPGETSASLPFSLSGSETGPFSMRVVVGSNGGADTIVLVGTMRKQVAAAHVLQLSSDTINVGSLASLRCTVTPALVEGDAIDALSFKVNFPARSLFPQRAVLSDPNGSATLTSAYDGAGNLILTIRAAEGNVLTGETLFTVELEGLLTGEFVNEVGLTLNSAPSHFDPQLVSGTVYLYGCDVGKDLHFNKAGFAGRIAPNPVNDILGFDYIAPVDVPVSLYLIDLRGTEHLATNLPAGTGEPQQAGVDIATLAPGLYFVRLHVGERVVTDMMIKE